MSPASRTSQEKIEILIVEDSPTQAEMLRYMLEEKGYLVTWAKDGQQALAFMGEHTPSLVISDIVMPEMSGYELCRRIRTNQRTSNICVILLTSLSDVQDVVKSLACGADIFITKPYSENHLLTQVEQILANSRSYQSGKLEVEVEVHLAGKSRMISIDPQQMFGLLLSTYETAIQRNSELIQKQDELSILNEHLEELVEERTTALLAEITERKRTQAVLQISEARTRAIIENSSDGIVIVDRGGNICFVNPSAEAFFGRPAEQLVGTVFGFPVVEDTQSRLEIIRPDSGSSKYVAEMRVSELLWEGQPARLASLRDITEQVRIEQAEREIVKMKATFIAGVTHDLRTPLTSLIGFLRLMKNDKEMDKAIHDEFLDLALEDAKRLASLTDDVLEASRLESTGNKIVLFDVDLCTLITISLKALEGIAGDKGITLHSDPGSSSLDIKADRRALRRVLDNLIGNAIRYSNPGGAVHVRAARTKAGVLVEVIDQGIGIPEEVLPNLFQKFFQGETLIKKSGIGTGLGLYIAKEIVEAHGGTIGVKSKPGAGSVFHFTIPDAKELVSEV